MSHNKCKCFPLKGDDLKRLGDYAAELRRYDKDRDALNKEFTHRAKTLSQENQATLYGLWLRMAASVGLDPQGSWDSGEYRAEIRYIEEGFGALVYDPPLDTFHEMMKTIGDKEPEIEELEHLVRPKGTKLN